MNDPISSSIWVAQIILTDSFKAKAELGGLARPERYSIAGILKTALPSWLIGPNSHSGTGRVGMNVIKRHCMDFSKN